MEGTPRAYLIGMVLAAIFAACNVYLGLKLGLIANLSIPATLLAFAAVQAGRLASGGAITRFSILENNLVQAAASAGGSVAAAGLVSSVPVLMILGLMQFSWLSLALWIAVVSAVGVAVAMLIRRPLIEAEELPFVPGVACATTLRQLHGASSEGVRQSLLLLGCILGAIALSWLTKGPTAGAPAAAGSFFLKPIEFSFLLAGVAAAKLGWALAFDPLYYAIGGLVGLRVSLSLLLGAVLAHGWLTPRLLNDGMLEAAKRADWISWPACALLVVGTIVPLLLSFDVIRRTFRGFGDPAAGAATRGTWLFVAIACALALVLQIGWLGIPFLLAVLGTSLALPLAMIAGRVAGEVGITPSGPLAKLSLITVGVTPGTTMQASLLSANLAGGAASQCADLLQDFRCGALLGASWRRQALAQILGALVGALAGAALLLWRFPDPRALLNDPAFAAPGVKPLLAVTEVLSKGTAAIPANVWPAVEIAIAAALVLLAIESLMPRARRHLVPSVVSVGFAFFLSPTATVAIALGGIAASVVRAIWPERATTLIVACTGLVIGSILFEIGYDAYRVFG